MDLATFQQLSKARQWEYLDGFCKGDKRIKPKDIVPCNPNSIGTLYCNLPFPNYSLTDSQCTIDPNNVLCGAMDDDDGIDKVRIEWQGYASQLYDGELKLSPQTKNASIRGTCNGREFHFQGSRHVSGVWPGFLLLYARPRYPLGDC